METQPGQSLPPVAEENKLASAEIAAENLENPKTEPNNPEEPMNFDAQLQNLDAQSAEKEKQLSEKIKLYEEWKSKVDAVRAELGMSPQDEKYLDQKSIDDIKTEIERLKEEKEIAEEGKDINDILAMLSALPATEINIIITTGKTSEGKGIKGKNGKEIKPNILKKLLDLAAKGAKALTIAGFKMIANGMKGIAGGIYEAEKNG